MSLQRHHYYPPTPEYEGWVSTRVLEEIVLPAYCTVLGHVKIMMVGAGLFITQILCLVPAEGPWQCLVRGGVLLKLVWRMCAAPGPLPPL